MNNPESRTGGAPWLENCWYQAGWAHELTTDHSLSRTILGRRLLFFRDTTGAPRAVLDRCPHRFAPLSAGVIGNGVVRCGYHGLAFDGTGRCVDNPHGPISSAMRVAAFPAVERHHALWVWLGSEPADEAGIPELPFIDASPATARFFGYMDTRAHYQLLTDNIMDLSHADYLHPRSLGGMMTGAKTAISEQDGAITVEWLADNCTAPPAFYSMVPPPSRADIWTRVTWRAPAVMILQTGANPAGTARDPTKEATTLHNMTPADALSSHYFFCTVRKFNCLDAGFNAMLGQLITEAFQNEDKPMLEKQQAAMNGTGFWDLKPLLLKIDTAAVRVRRSLDRAIEAERSRATAAPPHRDATAAPATPAPVRLDAPQDS